MFRSSILIMLLTVVGCSSGNLHDVKSVSKEEWSKQGFEVVGYEGYQWGLFGINNYGGARVWHRLRKIPDNGITYSGYIQKWGSEYHIYGPHAVDAIRPN
jgi:hypothetical protein